jgi:hypothetical protein
MSSKSSSPYVNITVELGRPLLDNDHLTRLQRVLQQVAPEWSASLYLWRHRAVKTLINVSQPSAFKELFSNIVTEHGEYYTELVKRYGPPRYPRRTGFFELRGASPAVIVVIHVDDHVLAPISNRWIWGNSVSVQVMRKKVEGVTAIRWTLNALQAICTSLAPVYAHAEAPAEYEAKNISHEGGTKAIGIDYAKALPGIYWCNFFGSPYRDLIGLNQLLTAPAPLVKEIDDGVILALSDNPEEWSSAEYYSIQRGVLEHLGPAHFYSRAEPNRTTIAPDFALKPS